MYFKQTGVAMLIRLWGEIKSILGQIYLKVGQNKTKYLGQSQ